MITDDYGGGGEGLAVDCVINYFHFYPLDQYQFEKNCNLNFTLILAAGSGTTRYHTIFQCQDGGPGLGLDQ